MAAFFAFFAARFSLMDFCATRLVFLSCPRSLAFATPTSVREGEGIMPRTLREYRGGEMSWLWFAVMIAAVGAGGVILWRRWRRWKPVQGKTPEAIQAELEIRASRDTGGV